MNPGNDNLASTIKLIECPRDAMQGWLKIIPTEKKAAYINCLLKIGFDTIDFGSFVSSKLIPQMADTKAVLEKIQLDNSSSKLLAIVANLRGAEAGSVYNEITYLGFPFSVSPTFQMRNTNSSMEESMRRIDAIQNICITRKKQLVVYLSMGFGNPYGDEYNEEILIKYAGEMASRGIQIISLADTIGIATPLQIENALNSLIPQFPFVEFGVHLHATAHNWKLKLDAAVNAGCKRFDGALKGIGGCPMAQDEMVGNMNTEWMIEYFQSRNLLQPLDEKALRRSLQLAGEIFFSPASEEI